MNRDRLTNIRSNLRFQAGGAGGMDGEFGLSRYKLIYRMDKHQGPTGQHRELYSISCNNP